MSVHECKQEDNIKALFNMSIPSWVRAILIGGIIALFVLYGGLWVAMTSDYATKQELRETKQDIKAEIQSGYKQILYKLEKMDK